MISSVRRRYPYFIGRCAIFKSIAAVSCNRLRSYAFAIWHWSMILSQGLHSSADGKIATQSVNHEGAIEREGHPLKMLSILYYDGFFHYCANIIVFLSSYFLGHNVPMMIRSLLWYGGEREIRDTNHFCFTLWMQNTRSYNEILIIFIVAFVYGADDASISCCFLTVMINKWTRPDGGIQKSLLRAPLSSEIMP